MANLFPETKAHHRLQYVLWVALMLANITILLVLVPDSLAKIRGASHDGDTIILPDKTPGGFTGESLYQLLDQMGEQGRQEYLRFHLTIDLMFPFLYGLFLALTIRILATLVIKRKLPGWLLPGLPLLAMLTDLAENHFLHTLTLQFPDLNPLLVMKASFFNILKWNLVYASALLIVVLLAVFLLKRFYRKLPMRAS